MKIEVKPACQIAIATVGYVAWGAIAIFVDRTQLGGFLHLNMAMAGGTILIVVRDMQSAGSPALKNDGGDAAP